MTVGALLRFREQGRDLQRVVVEVLAVDVGEKRDGEPRFRNENDDLSSADGSAALNERLATTKRSLNHPFLDSSLMNHREA